jgi:beta-lactamase regulating signal transducer with metallopeptidase domain
MNGFVIGVLAWMLAEILLTGALFGVYLIVRRLTAAASDRYRFLRVAFPLVTVLPWLPDPWALWQAGKSGAPASSLIATTAIKIRPVLATSASFSVGTVATAAVAAYVLVAATLLVRLGYSLVKLRRLAAGSELAFTHAGIPVRVTHEDVPPATFGLARPLILISRATLAQLSADELQMVLAHELGHIRRRDYASNLLKAVTRAVLIFSPFASRLARAFVLDMEMSCDALVVRRGAFSAKLYGHLLLRLSEATSSRNELVASGLFVTNASVSRRIEAMKYVHVKARPLLWVGAVALVGLVVGPAVTSLGLDAAVGDVLSPAGRGAARLAYQVETITAGAKKDAVSGTVALQEAVERELTVGALRIRITPHQVPAGWQFAVETRDTSTNALLQSSTVVTSDTETAQIDAKSAAATGADVRAFSLRLTPITKPAFAKTGKVSGLVESGDLVTLDFKEPTDLKDVIKAMARLSGKNIILSRDVDGKVEVVSARPIAKAEAYESMVAALDMIGVEALDEGRAVRLVRKAAAPR